MHEEVFKNTVAFRWTSISRQSVTWFRMGSVNVAPPSGTTV